MALHQVSVANTIKRMAFAIDFFDLEFHFIRFFLLSNMTTQCLQTGSPRLLHLCLKDIDNERHLDSKVNPKVEKSRPKMRRNSKRWRSN